MFPLVFIPNVHIFVFSIILTFIAFYSLSNSFIIYSGFYFSTFQYLNPFSSLSKLITFLYSSINVFTLKYFGNYSILIVFKDILPFSIISVSPTPILCFCYCSFLFFSIMSTSFLSSSLPLSSQPFCWLNLRFLIHVSVFPFTVIILLSPFWYNLFFFHFLIFRCSSVQFLSLVRAFWYLSYTNLYVSFKTFCYSY